MVKKLIKVDEGLYALAKQRADQENTTIATLIARGLRKVCTEKLNDIKVSY